MRAGASGGDLTCPICGKSGLTKGIGAAYHTDAWRGEQGKSKVRRREKSEKSRVGPERRIANQCRLGTWTTRNTQIWPGVTTRNSPSSRSSVCSLSTVLRCSILA